MPVSDALVFSEDTGLSYAGFRFGEGRAGPYAGYIAVISEIIDHKRAIINGPTAAVPRQVFSYKHITLTPLQPTGLSCSAGSGVIRKLAEKEALVEKWEKSAWGQKRAALQRRRSLKNFGRFKTMLPKKARRVVRKSLKKSKA